MKLGFYKVRRPFHQMNIAHAEVRTCMPSGFGGCSETGNKPTAIDWANWCFGPPFTWSSRYWDGTPEMAHHFYAMTAKLIKQKYPGIQVGGPASGASPSFFPCGDMSPSSLGMTWIRDFLLNVKAQGAPLDFFSFHYYGRKTLRALLAPSQMCIRALWMSLLQWEVLETCLLPSPNTTRLLCLATKVPLLVPLLVQRQMLRRSLFGSLSPGCMRPSSTREFLVLLKH